MISTEYFHIPVLAFKNYVKSTEYTYFSKTEK